MDWLTWLQTFLIKDTNFNKYQVIKSIWLNFWPLVEVWDLIERFVLKLFIFDKILNKNGKNNVSLKHIFDSIGTTLQSIITKV